MLYFEHLLAGRHSFASSAGNETAIRELRIEML